MERDAIDFGSLKVSVLFRRLFIPTLCGMLSISAVTVADGIFVGQGVGSDGIAAVNIYVPLLMVFQGMGFMIGIGCSVVASIHLSQSKIRAARLNVTQAMVFVTAVTLLLSSAILLFPDRTAVLLGASEHLLPLVKDYLLWFTPALVFQMWTAVGLSLSVWTGRRSWRCGAVLSRRCSTCCWTGCLFSRWGGASWGLRSLPRSVYPSAAVSLCGTCCAGPVRCPSVRLRAAARACASRCGMWGISVVSAPRPCWAKRLLRP